MIEAGWEILPFNEDLAAWAEHSKKVALEALADPDNAAWFRCSGTWFAGVDCLPNDAEGRLENGPRFPKELFNNLPDLPLHQAQISAIFPGYPKPMEGESEGAANYRLRKDAAHVDGLLPHGPRRRRYLQEPHAYILGLPLTQSPAEASPLVVWEGSHIIMGQAFRDAYSRKSPKDWPSVDITDVYHAARRSCFDRCKRKEIHAEPGQATIVHRLTLHGMAPWRSKQEAPRIVAYFRPQGRFKDWPVV